MAKEAPTVSVIIDDSATSARTISNDVTGLSWAIPRAVQDVTGVDKAAIERLLLLADLSMTADGVFNDATNMSHDVFKTVGSTSVIRTVTLAMSGKTLASEQFLTDYAVTRASSGELTWSVPGVLGDGTAPTWS
jgi:hypothetical protein